MAVPPWCAAFEPNCWYQISGDRPDQLPPTPLGTRYLGDTDPALDSGLNPVRSSRDRLRRALGRRPQAPWSGRSGFASITEAWNSAVYAPQPNTTAGAGEIPALGNSGAMLHFGGGHNDYFGSSVHAFDLASRQWQRLTDGYCDGRRDRYGAGAYYAGTQYPDRSPLPPHTYGYLQYDPDAGNLLLFKGQRELGENVQAAAIPHQFNLRTLRWQRGPEHPTAILNSGGFTVWDASRGALWGHSGDSGGGNALLAYYPDGAADAASDTTGEWGAMRPNQFPGQAEDNTMQITRDTHQLLVANHHANGLFAIDPVQVDAPAKQLVEVGDKPRFAPFASFEYSAELQSFIYFSAHDETGIYLLRPDTSGRWRWRRLAMHGYAPITLAATQTRHSHNAAHVFGRFRVAEFGGVTMAILVRHIDTSVFAAILSE